MLVNAPVGSLLIQSVDPFLFLLLSNHVATMQLRNGVCTGISSNVACVYVYVCVCVHVRVCVDYANRQLSSTGCYEMGSGLVVLLIDLANGNTLTSMNL